MQNANKNGLKVDDNEASKNITEGNTLRKECECDYDKYLMAVSGETDFKNPSKLNKTRIGFSVRKAEKC